MPSVPIRHTLIGRRRTGPLPPASLHSRWQNWPGLVRAARPGASSVRRQCPYAGRRRADFARRRLSATRRAARPDGLRSVFQPGAVRPFLTDAGRLPTAALQRDGCDAYRWDDSGRRSAAGRLGQRFVRRDRCPVPSATTCSAARRSASAGCSSAPASAGRAG